MTSQNGRHVALKVSLLAAGLLLAAGPSAAWAQNLAQGILYEVLENPPGQATPMGPLPGVYNPATGERMAQASETGALAGSGTLAFLSGSITVEAQSRVPFDPATGTFGAGTVSGVFSVDGLTGGSVAGKIDGDLDLSMLTSTVKPCPCPLAPTSGTWSTLGKNKKTGPFQGLFLLPFQYIDGGWYYLEIGPSGLPTGGLTPVQPSELKDGAPLVKLLVTLTQ